MARDPRYASAAARLINVEQLEEQMARLTRQFERNELFARLAEVNLCAGPVYSTSDLFKRFRLCAIGHYG